MDFATAIRILEATEGNAASLRLSTVDVLLAEHSDGERQRLRTALEIAAVPHWFDETILAALLDQSLGSEAENLAAHLRQLSLVEPFPARGPRASNVHEATRRDLRTWMRAHSPARLRELSARAGRCFGGTALHQRIEALYHRWTAEPEIAERESKRLAWEWRVSDAGEGLLGLELMLTELLEAELSESIALRAALDHVRQLTPTRSVAAREVWVSTPGLPRHLLDRFLPSLHSWLTRIGLFKPPLEWPILHEYLSGLRSAIANEIAPKTYVEPPSKVLPETVTRFKAKQRVFLTPIQQLVKAIVGLSQGSEGPSAQLYAISRKSRPLVNLARHLERSEEPLILLGDPGTGKSITLQHVAMLIAERESRRVFPTVCVFLRLGEFHVSGPATAESVWDYVKETAPASISPFLDSLAFGRLVLFFDGMDEMSPERYNEYTSALSIFAGSQKGLVKALFSCRISDFTPHFQHDRVVLLPFGRRHIYEYLKRQIPDFPIRIGGEEWTAWRLAKRLAEDSEGFGVRANNPFVLWLLCAYVQEEEDWPRSRVHLFEYYSRRNYERIARDSEQRAHRLPAMELAFLAWGRIAYEITCRNRGVAIPQAEAEAISQAEAQGLLADEELSALEAGVQCGILERGLDLHTPLVRFQHHRFQEYFAALHLHKHRASATSIDWLERLDAPRWQETLFNLVLLGGGMEALTVLDDSIRRGVEQHQGVARTGEADDDEAVLADRVELAARILQQARPLPEERLHHLSQTTQSAIYWLADHGNPITMVKMLWASQLAPGIDVLRVARRARATKVPWLRRQALIVTSATSSEVSTAARFLLPGGLMLDAFMDALSWVLALRGPIGFARYTRESWLEALRDSKPRFQATLLRRTTPETLGLSVDQFLRLLQQAEVIVKKEPALSAYWAKRYQMDQIIRQERVG